MSTTRSSKSAKNGAASSPAKKSDEPQQFEEVYLNDSVENFDFSDHVRIRTTTVGVVLSFGKIQMHRGKILMFKEVLVPFPVADSLWQIIRQHLDQVKQAIKEAKDKSDD